MGEVYLADQFAVDRKVVVKIVHAGLAQLHPSVVERFKREARALAQISHPNIVHLYAFGATDDGHPFFAMEFVPGDTLERVLSRGPLLVARALRIALQTCHALREAHDHDVVHRDLKPANIMLKAEANGRDTVKLVDFGIAKALDDPGKLTQPGALFGTPRYMAPEQARGLPVDGRSDLYALGLVMYEMLTGVGPFNAKTPYDFIAQQVSVQPEAPSRKRLHVPPRVDSIVLRCLEKEPARRYAKAQELADDLELALQELAEGTASPPKPHAPNAAVVSDSSTIRSLVAGGVVLETNDESSYEAARISEPPPSSRPQPRAARTARGAVGRMLRFWPWAIFFVVMYNVLPHGGIAALLSSLAPKTWQHEQVSDKPTDKSVPWVAYAGAALGSEREAVAGYTFHCLNRFSARVSDSHSRYLSWVDPSRGPTPKDRTVRGVYPIADPGPCIGHIQQAQLVASVQFRNAAEMYAKALADLAQQLGAAEAYYATEAYKDDAMTKGQELHAPLMRAYAAYFAADQPLRALVVRHLEQTGADASQSPVDRVRVAVRHLVAVTTSPFYMIPGVPKIRYASELEALTQALAVTTGDSHEACDNPEHVRTLARTFLAAIRQFGRVADAGKSAQTATLIDKGNAVLSTYNMCTLTRGLDVELEFVKARMPD
jgi:serine/threonine protein kinase